MVLLTEKFVAFGALLFITATGLALIVIGASLLSWAAYLSPWMPSWVWMALAAFTAFGVAVTALGCATAIATVAPKPQAAHKCLVVLLLLLAIEIALSALGALRQPVWSHTFYDQVYEKMHDSLNVYSTNETSAAMWDEIQNEVSCCGVMSYENWFTSGFGDGSSVPDACCLLPNPGCGMGVRNSPDVKDVIDTEGCLPVLSSAWSASYRALTRKGLLPIFVIQVIMITVLVLSYRSSGILSGHVPIRVKGMTAPQPHYSLMA